MGGNFDVHNNSAATTLAENTVAGDLLDHNNTGPTQILSNIITGNLQCQQNAFVTGGGNSASQTLGQCVGF